MRAVVYLLLMAIVLTALPQDVGSYNPLNGIIPGSLELIVTCPQMDYDIGSVVTLQVRMFGNGAPLDPGSVNLSIVERPPRHGDVRELNLTRIGTGLLAANVDVLATDINPQGLLWFYSEATYGKYKLWEYCKVDTVYHRAFTVDAYLKEPDDLEPAPGEVIEVEILTRFMGTLMNPVEIKDGCYCGIFPDLNHNVSIGGDGHIDGRHNSSFEAPRWRYYEYRYLVSAISEYKGIRLEATGGIDFSMGHSFDVWAYAAETTANRTVLELHIMDLDGMPVQGALVSLVRFPYQWEQDSEINITTDGHGRATLDMPFGLPDDSSANIEGTVHSSRLSQNFIINLAWPEDLAPDPPFSPISRGYLRIVTTDPILDNGTVELRMVPTNPTDDLDGKEYIFYVSDEHEVYFNGVVTGDENGTFTLSLRIPDLEIVDSEKPEVQVSYCAMDRNNPFSSRTWMRLANNWTGPREAEPPILGKLNVDRSRTNGTINIGIDDALVDGCDEDVWILVGMGINATDVPDLLDVINGFWHSSLVMGGWDYLPQAFFNLEGSTEAAETILIPCNWNGTTYSAQIVVPPLVSEREDLFFIGVIEEKATGEVHIALENVPPPDGDGRPTPPRHRDGTPFSAYLPLLMVGAVVIVAGTYLWLRKNKPVS